MAELFALPKQWTGWKLEGLIKEDEYTKFYIASKERDIRVVYSTVQCIRVPGAKVTDSSFLDYMEEEISVNYKLRGIENILCYDNHLIQKDSASGDYLIYTRMNNVRRLSEMIGNNAISLADIMNCAVDICSAIEVMQQKNIVHGDIRPENIFIDDEGRYRLGNFGIWKILYKAAGVDYVKNPRLNIAPEFIKENKLETSSDIYSLGLMIYKLLNNDKPLFSDKNVSSMTKQEIEHAFSERMSSRSVPYPQNCAIADLCQIVMRACEYNPSERWQNPRAIKKALASILEEYSEGKSEVPAFSFINEGGTGKKAEEPELKTAEAPELEGVKRYESYAGKGTANSANRADSEAITGNGNNRNQKIRSKQGIKSSENTIAEDSGSKGNSGGYISQQEQNPYKPEVSGTGKAGKNRNSRMGMGIIIGFLSACAVVAIVCVVFFAYPGIFKSDYTSVNGSGDNIITTNHDSKDENNDKNDESLKESTEEVPSTEEKKEPESSEKQEEEEPSKTEAPYEEEDIDDGYYFEKEPVTIESPVLIQEDTGLYGDTCYADVDYFLTLRAQADRLSEPIAFLPAMTKMTIWSESEVNGMLFVSVDETGDVGYINSNYICYSMSSAVSDPYTSPADEILYPIDKYIYLVKKGAYIYNEYGVLIDVLEEDELAYIVGESYDNYMKILMIDTALANKDNVGYISMEYLECTWKS